MPSGPRGVRDSPDPSLADRIFLTGPESHSDLDLLTSLLESTRFRHEARPLAEILLREGREYFTNRAFDTIAAKDEFGPSMAARLAVLLEFGRRLARPSLEEKISLISPDRVSAYLRSRTSHYREERVGVLLLDSRHRLIVDREVIRGSLDSAGVTPKDILRAVLLDAASAFIVYHNHPSGDPTPSRDDVEFTQVLARASREVGIRLLDHLVVGSEGVISLSARGLLGA